MRGLARAWGRPPDETAAWACLTTNLLVLPGLGSLMGGRRVGWLQSALSVAGFSLSLAFMLDVFHRWVGTGRFPFGEPGPWLVWALAGLALFGTSWVWSLVTGLDLVRVAPKDGPGDGAPGP